MFRLRSFCILSFNSTKKWVCLFKSFYFQFEDDFYFTKKRKIKKTIINVDDRFNPLNDLTRLVITIEQWFIMIYNDQLVFIEFNINLQFKDLT